MTTLQVYSMKSKPPYKLIIISDTHLTNRFHAPKYEFLKNLVASTEEVILNGDFWDSYFTSFQDFIQSDWKKLFPLLKQKNALYLYGNHDREIDSDSRASLFSTRQTHTHTMRVGPHVFAIEHGNRFQRALSEKMPALRNAVPILRQIVRVENSIEWALMNVFGWHHYTKMANTRIKRLYKAGRKNNEVLVIGHTHCPEFDLEFGFLNSGKMSSGHATYLTIDWNDDIKLHYARY